MLGVWKSFIAPLFLTIVAGLALGILGGCSSPNGGGDSGYKGGSGTPTPTPAPAPTYQVFYDGNDCNSGTVPLDKKTYTAGTLVTVLGNTGSLAKDGKVFAGWNTAQDGQGASYSAGQTLIMGSSNLTLYAVWTNLPTYQVIYDANQATYGQGPTDPNGYLPGTTVTVLAGSLSRDGYTYAGWSTNPDGTGQVYQAGNTWTMGTHDVTLYAIWTQDPTFTMTYDGNQAYSGFPPTDSNNYLPGMSVTVLGNDGALDRGGYRFDGWNTQADGKGIHYAPGATFTMGSEYPILYAVWTGGSGGIDVTIPGNLSVTLTTNSPVSSGTVIIAGVTTSEPVDSYAWYMDGTLLIGLSTASIQDGSPLSRGPHTLMVVVQSHGVSYSASALVTVQ